jgi:hypothetical protein
MARIGRTRIARLFVVVTVTIGGFFFSANITRVYLEKDNLSWKTTVYELEGSTLESDDGNVVGEADSLIVVAIVACTKSKNDWKSINVTTLHNILIPSIERTVTPSEKKHVRVDLVVGFDDNDPFWNDPRNRKELQASTHVPISFVSVPKQPSRPFRIPFNEVCRATYEYGADFIARVNDDSEFITPGWITKGVKRLSQYNPPWVGVVGPTCRQGNTKILTHDFVHRTHIDIFDTYYPDDFDNWWIDDWITYVYGPKRTTRLPDWEMFHHTSKHGQRYQVEQSLKRKLPLTLRQGAQQIELFVQRNESQVPIREPTVLGTDLLAGIWGPIADSVALYKGD